MADGIIEGVLYDLRALNHGDCTYDVEAGAASKIKERASIGILFTIRGRVIRQLDSFKS